MKRLSIIGVATASLILGFSLVGGSAVGQQNAQLTADVEGVNVASQVFIAAISARDIGAIDKVWAHEPYATFMGAAPVPPHRAWLPWRRLVRPTNRSES